MVKLSSSGEVGQFTSVTQFDGGSTGKCGFYATTTVVGSAAPGGHPWSAASIASSADQHFVQFDGADIANNQTGMTQASLHSDLATYKLTGQDISADWNTVKQSLANGYPVIVCLPEDQVVDMGLSGSPYPWNSTGLNHIILLTGIAADGNVLVRDSANIVAPNNVRPGPRTYKIIGLSPYWATAVTPAWYASITPQGGTAMTVPTGWKDNGTTLTAPNGIPITDGFRTYILTHTWDAGNIPLAPAQGLSPLELSNPGLGGGTQQVFRWTTLEWTSKQKTFEAWTGPEFITTRNLLHTTQSSLDALRTAYNAVVAEKNNLVEQNATLKAQPSSNDAQLQQQIAALTEQNTALAAQVNVYYTKLAQIVTDANLIAALAKQ
jgi:hypothetical protein